MNDQMANARALYRPESAATAPQPDSDRRWRIMVALWERMAQYFGQRWEREYGTTTDQTINAWRGALNRFSEDEIAGAVKSLTDWDSPHPPNFAEFRALCMAARSKIKPTWTDDRLEAERTRGRGVAGVLEDLGKGRLTEAAKAELRKMAAIYAVELDIPKAESYRQLGLERRWGPL